jgi:hypothetical protein
MNLFKLFHKRQGKARPQRRATRLTVEALEGRVMPAVSAQFDWSMPSRFGVDSNGDGRIDLPNNSSYVGQAATPYEVDFHAQTNSAIRSYTWQIMPPTNESPLTLNGATPTLMLPNGTYMVKLTVTGYDGSTSSSYQQVQVKDLLIVSLGDSYASGEGNPEWPANSWRQYAPGEGNPDPPLVGGSDGLDHSTPWGAPAQWADEPDGYAAYAHRSTKAAPALAAREIEASDPHSSVTFVSVAASGDKIDTGLLAPRSWIDGPHDKPNEPEGQIDQVVDMLTVSAGNTTRQIDALTISIGGNDIAGPGKGFQQIVADMAQHGLSDVQKIWDPVLYNTIGFVDPHLGSATASDATYLESLRANSTVGKMFDTLAQKLAAPAHPGSNAPVIGNVQDATARGLGDNLTPSHVYITEYPELASNADGTPEGRVLGDVVPGLFWFGIGSDKIAWATQVEQTLNQLIREKAAAHGWNFVDGIAAAFRGHGYDAPDGQRWIRTATESMQMQGPQTGDTFQDVKQSTGTLHPNLLGQQAIAQILVDRMRGRVWDTPPVQDARILHISDIRPARDHVRVTFSKPVDPSSVTAASLFVADSQGKSLVLVGPPSEVPGSQFQKFDLQFQPQPQGGYQVVATKAVTDLWGNPVQPSSIALGDFTAPYVVSSQASSQHLTVTFSKPIDTTTFTFQLTGPTDPKTGKKNNTPVPGTSWSVVDAWHIDITVPKFPRYGYTLVVGPGIRDLFGNLLVQSNQGKATYYTQAIYDSTLTSIVDGRLAPLESLPGLPSAGGRTFLVAFNKLIDRNTVADAVHIVGPNGVVVPVLSVAEGSWPTDGTAPADTLAISFAPPIFGSYTITFSSSVTDLYGNALSPTSPGTFQFSVDPITHETFPGWVNEDRLQSAAAMLSSWGFPPVGDPGLLNPEASPPGDGLSGLGKPPGFPFN